jgi:bifunctional non-homologous end joining protein LigD
MATLSIYKKKRNFGSTAEPEGKVTKSSKQLRFVIQRHAASRLHYDFRLEMEGVLKSWAVPKGPSLNPADKRLAMMVEDHPYDYRTFEGTIPEREKSASTAAKDEKILLRELKEGSLKFILNGKKLKGEFALVKMRTEDAGNAWLLIKHKDEYAVSTKYDAEKFTNKTSKVTRAVKKKAAGKATPKKQAVKKKPG